MYANILNKTIFIVLLNRMEFKFLMHFPSVNTNLILNLMLPCGLCDHFYISKNNSFIQIIIFINLLISSMVLNRTKKQFQIGIHGIQLLKQLTYMSSFYLNKKAFYSSLANLSKSEALHGYAQLVLRGQSRKNCTCNSKPQIPTSSCADYIPVSLVLTVKNNLNVMNEPLQFQVFLSLILGPMASSVVGGQDPLWGLSTTAIVAVVIFSTFSFEIYSQIYFCSNQQTFISLAIFSVGIPTVLFFIFIIKVIHNIQSSVNNFLIV